MKVYARSIDGAKLKKVEISHDLGIEISHNGKSYSLAVDNFDRLILRSIDTTQLILLPQSSNTVEVKTV